jgi:hypothetical protein
MEAVLWLRDSREESEETRRRLLGVGAAAVVVARSIGREERWSSVEVRNIEQVFKVVAVARVGCLDDDGRRWS